MKWDSLEMLLKISVSHDAGNTLVHDLGEYIIAIYHDKKKCDIYIDNPEGKQRRKYPQLIKRYTIDKLLVNDYIDLINSINVDDKELSKFGIVKSATKNISLFGKGIYISNIEILNQYGEYFNAREKHNACTIEDLTDIGLEIPKNIKLYKNDFSKYTKYELYYFEEGKPELMKYVINKRGSEFASRKFYPMSVKRIRDISKRIRSKESNFTVRNKRGKECTIVYAKPIK